MKNTREKVRTKDDKNEFLMDIIHNIAHVHYFQNTINLIKTFIIIHHLQIFIYMISIIIHVVTIKSEKNHQTKQLMLM